MVQSELIILDVCINGHLRTIKTSVNGRYNMWKFVIVVCLFHTGYGYVEQKSQNFTSARGNCILATPKINFTAAGPTVDLGSINGLNDGETAWIGYTQDYEIFQYLGCVESFRIQRPVTTSFTIQKNIGQCQFFCKTYQYFSVKALPEKGAECRCLNVTNPNFTSEWISSCDNNEMNDEFPFGSNSKLSIYKIVSAGVRRDLQNIDGWTESDSNCVVWFQPTANIYHWDECSKNQKVLCKSKNTLTTWEPQNESFLKWKDATERCLRNNTILIPYQDRSNVNDTASPQYWISNIRAFVISNLKEGPLAGSTQYGYIRRSGDQYLLHFEPKSPNTTRKALCEGIGNSVTLPGSFITTPYKTTTDTTESNSNSTKDPEAFNGSKPAENENVAVFVAVPVVFVLLLVCGVIVGIIIWRRRKAKIAKASAKHYRKTILANSCADTNGNNELRQNSSEVYNEIGDIDESTHKDYDIIKDEWKADPTRNSVNNQSYSVLEKTQNGQFQAMENDDYDFAQETKTNETMTQNHAYHALEQRHDTNCNQVQKDKTTGYDYAKVMPRSGDKTASHDNHIDPKCNEIGVDDYDHLDQGSAINKKPEHKQQIVGNVYNKINVNDNVDTYDHINSGANDQRNSLGGNAMGFNALSRTYNKWIDVSPDDTDTYNHVNKIQSDSFNKQTYNTTKVPNVKQVESGDLYDHTN